MKRIELAIPLLPGVGADLVAISAIGNDWRNEWLSTKPDTIELNYWRCGILEQLHGHGQKSDETRKILIFSGRTNIELTTSEQIKKLELELSGLAKKAAKAVPGILTLVSVIEIGNHVGLTHVEQVSPSG